MSLAAGRASRWTARARHRGPRHAAGLSSGRYRLYFSFLLNLSSYGYSETTLSTKIFFSTYRCLFFTQTQTGKNYSLPRQRLGLLLHQILLVHLIHIIHGRVKASIDVYVPAAHRHGVCGACALIEQAHQCSLAWARLHPRSPGTPPGHLRGCHATLHDRRAPRSAP